jgi:hypothetical protein
LGTPGQTVEPDRTAARVFIPVIGENLPVGDRLSEILYGVLMVSSISGLVEYVGPRDETGLRYMIIVLFTTIILWGLLDGFSYAMISAGSRAEKEALIESLAKEPDREKRLAAIREDVEATMPYTLDEEAKGRIFEVVDRGLAKPRQRMVSNKLTDHEKKIILAAFLLDFVPLIFLVTPYFFVPSVRLGALISHSMAFGMFVVIGYLYAKNAHMTAWKGAFICGAVGLAIICFADITGMVVI